MAAEAVCSLALYAGIREPWQKDLRKAIHEAYAAKTRSEQDRAVVLEGEAMQTFWVETLADVRGWAADRAVASGRVAERVAGALRAAEQRPVVALFAAPAARSIEGLREADDKHRQWLALVVQAVPPPEP